MPGVGKVVGAELWGGYIEPAAAGGGGGANPAGEAPGAAGVVEVAWCGAVGR